MKRILLIVAMAAALSVAAKEKPVERALVFTLPDISFETTTCATLVQVSGDDGKPFAVICIGEDGTTRVGLTKTVLSAEEMRSLVQWWEKATGSQARTTYGNGWIGIAN